MRWCQDLVKHRGAGPTPPGRGQKETDKCAAAGVSPVSRLRGRSHVFCPRQGAAELLRAALLPGVPSLRQAPRNPVPHPHPVLQFSFPLSASHHLHLAARHPGFTTCPESGSSAAPLEASRPAAGAEPGSSPTSWRWGICDSPHDLRLGAQADSSTEIPACRTGRFNTFPKQLFPDRCHFKVVP